MCAGAPAEPVAPILPSSLPRPCPPSQSPPVACLYLVASALAPSSPAPAWTPAKGASGGGGHLSSASPPRHLAQEPSFQSAGLSGVWFRLEQGTQGVCVCVTQGHRHEGPSAVSPGTNSASTKVLRVSGQWRGRPPIRLGGNSRKWVGAGKSLFPGVRKVGVKKEALGWECRSGGSYQARVRQKVP